MKRRIIFAALLPLALPSLGCSKSEASPSAGATKAQVSPVGMEAFKSRCAPCHGESGHGDGPASAALTPKPRNYTDTNWQKSVKDDDIRKTILYGGAAVGKSPAMPASPDLDGKPELAALVAVVRAFDGK